MIAFVQDDGGRAAAGYKGSAGDCVTRAIAIACELPYAEVYAAMADGNSTTRVTRGRRAKTAKARSARNGIFTRDKWFRDYMAARGWKWTPTMKVGQGCKVHLRADELPKGRIIVSVSKHYAAVIDGVLHDTADCSREGSRCVYGYWSKA